jgi:hypothetical protein
MPALINEAKVSVTCLFGKIKSDNPSLNTVKGQVRLSHLYHTWPHILVGSIGACRQVWSMGGAVATDTAILDTRHALT